MDAYCIHYIVNLQYVCGNNQSIKHIYMQLHNPAGTPGYINGTESFFGLKGRPSVVRDVKIHNQPVLRMRRK
jgi:hypothetical protein